MTHRPSSSRVLVTLLSVLWASVLGAPLAVADDVPRPDLDDPAFDGLARTDLPPTRARWFFLPDDPSLDPRVESTDPGLQVIGRLDRFGGAWILEADVEAVETVETTWQPRGALRRDVSGTPALAGSTRLVGARGSVWDDLEFFGDPAATVAILDSGLDTAHDDLGDPVDDDVDAPPQAGDATDWADAGQRFAGDPRLRVVGWTDVTDDLPEAAGPWDYHFHGTALASAAFGNGRVEDEGRGVAPNGRLAVVKTWNFEDRWELWASDLLLGIDWVLVNAARLNVRAVLIGATWSEDFGFGPAVEALNAAGILVIVPAGNDPSVPMGYPARMDGVFTVGAVDPQGRVASYSVPAPVDGTGQEVDLVAPGGSALDPDARVRVADNEPQDGYAFRFGTSIAAGHVAGAVSVLSEVMASTVTPWRREAAQTSAIADLLRITTARVETAELTSDPVPRANGTSWDRRAGRGMLQLRAAVDALRDVAWPGDERAFLLDAPTNGIAVRAFRVLATPGRRLSVTLDLPGTLDADLHVYREDADGYPLVDWSAKAGAGVDESAQVEVPREGWVVVVVRRRGGLGTARVRVDDVGSGLSGWPLVMSGAQRTVPTAIDIDGDGDRDVVAVNNLALRADVHVVFAVDVAGADIGFFPEQYPTPGLPGEFSTPAALPRANGPGLVVGSDFGRLYAFDVDANVDWEVVVDDLGQPTTTPAVADPRTAPWVVVGTANGVSAVDAEGNERFTWPAAAAVTEPVAAGDLIGDGGDEIVAVDTEGNVVALDASGNVVPGWPRALGAQAQAPVLLGNGAGSRVAEIGVATLGDDDVARLYRFTPDGEDVGGGPVVLDTDGMAVRTVSPLVAARLERAADPAWIVATLAGGEDSAFVLRLHVLASDGSQTVLRRTYGEPRFTDAVLRIYRRRLGEPRVAELTGGGTREVLVPVVVGWADERASREIRFAVTDEFVRFDFDAGTARAFPRAHPRDRFPDIDPLAPLVFDLDGDRVPEWVAPRANSLAVLRGTMVADDEDGWTEVRGGTDRRACVDCVARIVVTAPERAVVDDRVAVSPNPFNPRTRLEARVAADVAVEWSVFDTRGRLVRRFRSRSTDDGTATWVFDGTDLRGRPLASGVYHVEAHTPSHTARARLVLVR